MKQGIIVQNGIGVYDNALRSVFLRFTASTVILCNNQLAIFMNSILYIEYKFIFYFLLQGICLMTFVSHENWVRCIIFHPSGKYIISSSDDKTVRIMDIKVRFLIFLRKFLPMIFIIHTNYLIVIIFHNFFYR